MPDPTSSASLTREPAVLVASRLFVAYLLFWVVDDITLLPRQVLSITHYIHQPASFYSTYMLRGYVLDLLGNVLRMTLWLMAAGWFYRCGPRIRDFFAARAEQPTTSLTPPPRSSKA
jgi:hypothetical protein